LFKIELVEDGGRGHLSVHMIPHSEQAEQIVRGFIHSGYKVTITEIYEHNTLKKSRIGHYVEAPGFDPRRREEAAMEAMDHGFSTGGGPMPSLPGDSNY